MRAVGRMATPNGRRDFDCLQVCGSSAANVVSIKSHEPTGRTGRHLIAVFQIHIRLAFKLLSPAEGSGNSSLQEPHYERSPEAAGRNRYRDSYIHAPRALSVAEVIRQLASVFPGLDRTTIVHRIRKSRRMDAAAVATAHDPV